MTVKLVLAAILAVAQVAVAWNWISQKERAAAQDFASAERPDNVVVRIFPAAMRDAVHQANVAVQLKSMRAAWTTLLVLACLCAVPVGLGVSFLTLRLLSWSMRALRWIRVVLARVVPRRGKARDLQRSEILEPHL
jgi:hypothetical protein